MSECRRCRVDRAERHGAHGFGHTVKELARAWRAEFDRRFRPMGLSDTSWVVIWLLSEHGTLPQGRVAELLGVEGPTLVRLLDRMEKEGWVRRQPSETDRRVKLVALTGQARPVYDAMLDTGFALRDELMDDIPEEHVAIAHTVMLRLLDKLNGLDGLSGQNGQDRDEAGACPPCRPETTD